MSEWLRSDCIACCKKLQYTHEMNDDIICGSFRVHTTNEASKLLRNFFICICKLCMYYSMFILIDIIVCTDFVGKVYWKFFEKFILALN